MKVCYVALNESDIVGDERQRVVDLMATPATTCPRDEESLGLD